MTTAEKTGYDVREVPERHDGLSRWFLSTSPRGQRMRPSENLALVAGQLASERVAEAPKIAPEPVTVRLYAADTERVYPRGTVRAVPEFENRRPSRIFQKLRGASLIDSLLLGQEAFEFAPDRECWEALRETLAAGRMASETEAMRRLNDWVALALLARAGIRPPASRADLPAPGTPHEED